MKSQTLIPLVALLLGCPNPTSGSGPPLDRLYFPMAIAHVDVPGKTEGVLFVANANADKRYATGSLVAIPLDSTGLPAIGATGEVQELTALHIAPSQSVQVASFTGELSVQPTGPGSYRLFVPTRSEGMKVFQTLASIDAEGVPSLSCVDGSQNCVGTSLTPPSFRGSDAGIQWALTPYGVAAATRTCSADAECCDAPDCGRTCAMGQCQGRDGRPFADVWFTYAGRADSKDLIGQNNVLIGHLARLDSDDFTLKPENLFSIGAGGANSVAVGGPWVYVSGRFLNPAPNLMRLVNRQGVVLSTALESLFRVSDARSIALSPDGTRLYMVGRSPDTLLIASITDADGVPTLNFVRGVALPDAPNEVKLIPRAGRGDLAVVSCTAAGSVVIYDDDVGDLVSLINGVGAQPYGVAVDVRADAARIFVSNHRDGRIAVIDIPELNRPQGARLVARLGEQQVCLTAGQSSPACRAIQGAAP